MSASVDQRMKGQGGPVSNGPKDPVNDEEFDSWRNQHHPSYNTPMSASGMGDPYMSSYYGMSFPPYQNLGLNEGAWSNGSETMTFLGGYSGQMGSEQHSHYMDGMLGGGGAFGGFSQPGFNYFHGNGDYSAWGTSGVGRKPAAHAQHYDEYYREVYGTDPGTDRAMAAAASAAAAAAALKPLEQGMQSLGLTDKVDSKGDGKPAGPMVVDHGKIGAGQTGASGVVAEGLAMTAGNSGGPQAPKKMTWASVASQPAKPQPKIKPKSIPPAPMLPGKHNNLDIGTWESKNGNAGKGSVSGGPAVSSAASASTSSSRAVWVAPRGRGSTGSNVPSAYPAPTGMNPAVGSNAGIGVSQVPPGSNSQTAVALGPCTYPQHPILDKLRQTNDYNPKEYDLNPKNVRFFIIKSYSEDDIHRSIKYGIWCSTEHGNKRLDGAYREMEGRGAVYLLFSVNGSGHFCGMAQMMSEVDHNATSNVWAQDKWKGVFRVKWIYVKDVPNSQLRHIRLENNENKPVTNSRDTQEVPTEKGKQVLKIMHVYRHSTSIFDDFVHYEKRQEEEDQRRQVPETLVRLQQVKGRRGQPN